MCRGTRKFSKQQISIGETVRSVFDVMDFTLKEKLPGLLIFLHFQKAFDSLEWNFLLSCLEAFNFGPSGLMVNTTKTEGMWIGSSRENKAKPLGMKWPNKPIKALGIYYTYDLKLLPEKNFIERLDSVKKLINIWSSRGLSIYGKVTVIKSLIIPKLVYISSLLTTPKGIIQELNLLLFKFLWKGTDKVTRLSAINEYENGGLKMIDLESMIQGNKVFDAMKKKLKDYYLLIKSRKAQLPNNSRF